MSRIGKSIIVLPQGVKLTVDKGIVFAEGPKGKTSKEPKDHPIVLPQGISIVQEGQNVTLVCDDTVDGKFHGLYRALVQNAVIGVSEGYSKKLELQGVGYRSTKEGNTLKMALGFSHPVIIPIPSDIQIEVDKTGTKITVSGIDKRRVGLIASEIRDKRPPEPYKGKGVRYEGEYVRRKAGKTAKAK